MHLISAWSGGADWYELYFIEEKTERRRTAAIQESPPGGPLVWDLNPERSYHEIPCLCASLAVPVGRRGPGGDGEVEEGAHRGPEGDQEAAGERDRHQPLPVPSLPSICKICVFLFLFNFCLFFQ